MLSLRIAAFALCSLLLFPAVTRAQADHNLRILFHGVKAIGDDANLGFAGWIVAPNVSKIPDKWLVVAGPRYKNDVGWLEVMGGFFIQRGEATPLIDVRASFSPFAPFTGWTNLQYVDPSSDRNSSFYAYLQVDYPLPWSIGSVGVETENVFQVEKSVISAGPHVVVPFNALTLVAAYQFHRRADDQVWFRMVVNF